MWVEFRMDFIDPNCDDQFYRPNAAESARALPNPSWQYLAVNSVPFSLDGAISPFPESTTNRAPD